MDALGCEELWCIHSKIVTIAIGAPSPLLGKAIEEVVRFELPDRQPLPGKEGQLEATEKAADGAESERQLTERQLAERQVAERQLAEQQLAERQVTGRQGRELEEEQAEDGAGGSGEAPLDALKLKFDVAVHVRSAHKCVEQAQDAATCSDRGLPGVAEVLDVFPGLHNSASVQRWACFSHFLAFLLRLKIQRHLEALGPGKGKPPRVPLLQSEEDREELNEFLSKGRRKAENHPNATVPSVSVPPELAQKLTDLELWKVEDSEMMALEARLEARRAAGHTVGTEEGSPGPQLAILLVTDSEALRPLFVEFLRPFGTVAYSAAKVVHLVHRVGDDTTRLGNLAEFYLMSRASAIISYRSLRSTYARVAALYGNTTLIYGLEGASCKYPLEHMGMPVQ